jgi:hypothetical protein
MVAATSSVMDGTETGTGTRTGTGTGSMFHPPSWRCTGLGATALLLLPTWSMVAECWST